MDILFLNKKGLLNTNNSIDIVNKTFTMKVVIYVNPFDKNIKKDDRAKV